LNLLTIFKLTSHSWRPSIALTQTWNHCRAFVGGPLIPHRSPTDVWMVSYLWIPLLWRKQAKNWLPCS
jgi:hypothetical protein